MLGSLVLNPFIFWIKEPKPIRTIGALYGEGLCFSDIDIPPWRDQGKTGRSLLVPNARISSLTLSKGGTARLMCTPRILAGANLEVGITSLMKRILKACNWRLTVCKGGYAASDEERFIQALTPLLMTMGTADIGRG